MITNTMTYNELSKELLKLNSALSMRGDGWLKKYSKEIKKIGTQCLSCQKIDTNLYFILIANRSKIMQGFGFIYLLLRDDKWIAILQAETKNGFNVDMEVYEPHFFSRYNERFNVGKTGIDLMFQYFKDNVNEFSVVKKQEHNNKTYRLSNIKNGMAICEAVEVGKKMICFYKTCISNNMLSKKQIDMKDIISKELDSLNDLHNKKQINK